MSRPRVSRIPLALAFAAAFASGASSAMDLPEVIGRADTAAEATVYLVPPMAVFITSLDEAQMQASACRYATTDPAAIHALVDLIKAGDVNASAVYQRPDVREGVYLALADGTRLKFLLQDHFGGRLPVNGVAETSTGGAIRTIGVTAKQTLATDLRQWATTRGGAGTGSACDRQSGIAAPTAPGALPVPPPR